MPETPSITYRLRPARPEDAPVLCRLILELAEYEKLREEAHPDPEALARHLHPEACPRVEALLAETPEGEALGFALFFHNYSTFLTNFGMYLEDLFVRPAYRGRGIGLALLREVARIAVARGCRRLDWQVLHWNTPAIGFYEKLGARPLRDWLPMRLEGEALQTLARHA